MFWIQSLLTGKIIKNKRGLELVTSGSSTYKTSSKRFIYLWCITYYQFKFHVIWSGFWVIPKITSANLCKLIHDIINYPTFICPFESAKCGKEGKKNTKIWISGENKKLFRGNKKPFFIIFNVLSCGEKIKKADTSFQKISFLRACA